MSGMRTGHNTDPLWPGACTRVASTSVDYYQPVGVWYPAGGVGVVKRLSVDRLSDIMMIINPGLSGLSTRC